MVLRILWFGDPCLRDSEAVIISLLLQVPPTRGFRASQWAFQPMGTRLSSGCGSCLHHSHLFHVEGGALVQVSLHPLPRVPVWTGVNRQGPTQASPGSADLELEAVKAEVDSAGGQERAK